MELAEMYRRKSFLLGLIESKADTEDTWIELDAINYAIWYSKK